MKTINGPQGEVWILYITGTSNRPFRSNLKASFSGQRTNSIIKTQLLEFQQNWDTWKLLSFPWMQGDCSALRLEGNSSAGRDGGNPVVWQVDRLTSCAKVGLKEGQENPHLHPATSSLPPAT